MNSHSTFQQFPELITERLKLRAFTHSDVTDVFEYASDEETTRFLTWPAHTSFETSQQVLSSFLIKSGVFAIELLSNKKVIGCIDIRPDDPNEKASFGYVLHRKYWNLGYMTEVLTSIVHFLFTELNCNRVESTFYTGNEKSGRVMQKAGLLYEGTGLQELKVKGNFVDVVHYGITRERWLNERNR